MASSRGGAEMDQLILPLSIAGIVIAALLLLFLLFSGGGNAKHRKELTNRVREYADPRMMGDAEDKPQSSVLNRISARSEAGTASLLAGKSYTAKLTAGLSAAGLAMRPEEWVLICAGSGAAVAALLFLLSSGAIAAGVLGAAVGLSAPALFLRVKVSRRQAAFVNDLADTLTELASGLTAGASLPQSLEGVASEAAGPMADELHRAIIETRLGTPIPDALDAAARRMKCEDLEMVVMAIRLQSSHGGNLAELLTTVAGTLRERVQMKRHVKALSAEGRMSLGVLMALPVGVLLFMAFVRPAYFQFFVGTGTGMIMLTIAAVMQLMGFLWARTIVRVEV